MNTRGELKGKVLRLLNKTGATNGFYTDDKLNDAVQECIDFVAVEMFIADGGWQTKVGYLATQANQLSLDIPPHMAMIKELRYLVGGRYLPMAYDDGSGQGSYAPGSGMGSQWGGVYRVIDNAFYFDPPLTDAGAQQLMVEYMAYPQRLQDDTDFIPSHFDAAMLHFIKYRAASILASSYGKVMKEWSQLETDWYQKLLFIVNRRNLQTTTIREFEG